MLCPLDVHLHQIDVFELRLSGERIQGDAFDALRMLGNDAIVHEPVGDRIVAGVRKLGDAQFKRAGAIDNSHPNRGDVDEAVELDVLAQMTEFPLARLEAIHLPAWARPARCDHRIDPDVGAHIKEHSTGRQQPFHRKQASRFVRA